MTDAPDITTDAPEASGADAAPETAPMQGMDALRAPETDGWTQTARPSPLARAFADGAADEATEPEQAAPSADGEDSEEDEPKAEGAAVESEAEAPEAEEAEAPEASEARQAVERETLASIREAVPGLGITALDQVPEVLKDAETQFAVLEVVEKAAETDPRVLPFVKALASGDSLHIALKAHMADLVRDIDEADPDYIEAERRRVRAEVERERTAADAQKQASHVERVQREVAARATDFRARVDAGAEIVPGVTLDQTSLQEIAAVLNPPRGARVRADLFEAIAFGLNRDAALAHAAEQAANKARAETLAEIAQGKHTPSGTPNGTPSGAALDPSLSSVGTRPSARTIDPRGLSGADRAAHALATTSTTATDGWTQTRRN